MLSVRSGEGAGADAERGGEGQCGAGKRAHGVEGGEGGEGDEGTTGVILFVENRIVLWLIGQDGIEGEMENFVLCER